MATYAIGDVQGCFDTLILLLEHIKFNPKHDKLWFAGDLVNRGPKSLDVLRYVYALGDRAHTVLGNHDLHLLAVYYGAAPHKHYDTFDDVLAAADAPQLCEWLRTQPLLHYDKHLPMVVTHAGLHPQWDLATAKQCAAEVENVLQSEHYLSFFQHMYGNQPEHWEPTLHGWERLRFITNVFTRMRLVSLDGRLDLRKKGSPEMADDNYYPWFLIPDRQNCDIPIVFGHWAALECNTGNAVNVYAIDSGCVWGNRLTALRLEDRQRFDVASVR